MAATAGTQQGYVYSTSASTYPNGGVSGSYYYDQRTTIESPTDPTGLTYPNPVVTASAAISWTAATSGTDYPVSQYEVSYSLNGTTWTVAGTTAETSYSLAVPAGAQQLTVRVRAQDSNGQWSDYATGTASPVYISPKLTVPQMVMQGQQATISWSAIEGADSYTLQRKANTDADWTQVYSGANLSYTETVGTWTSLQYRVQAVFGETAGGWATSGDIQIVSASALVISGTDGDLGILTNDVQYSISSDQTSPTIDVTVEVNGGEYAAFQATSGQTYTVSVLDLPTGTGSIVITATTEVSSSPVTVTRTWTYSKTAPTFPETGSVADLTQEGNTIWAKTIAEAVRAPGIWGGNLGLALSKLAGSVLYNRNQVAKYAEVTVSLSGKSEGDIIQLPENGRMVDFYVAKLDYESGLNGTGRVLLVRKDCYDSRAWDAGNVNAYASSDIDAWFNGTYKALFPQEIQTAMGTTKFYYTPGNGNWTVGTLERAIFALSLTELGRSHSYANTEGSALPIASTLQVVYRNGIPTFQWTRSPYTNGTSGAWRLDSDGDAANNVCASPFWSRPAFTLPSTFTYGPVFVANDDTIMDAQEYIPAGSFEDVQGNAVPVTRIETGSYVGTGTYGASNPNSLTFPFEPKVVFIVADIGDAGNSDSQNATGTFYFFVRGAQNTGTFGPSQNTDFRWKIFTTWGANSISWYRTAGGGSGASGGEAQVQMNRSGTTYYYVAIGLAGGAS